MLLCGEDNFDCKLAAVVIDFEDRIRGDVLGDDLTGDEGFYLTLDKPLQRSCAEVLVVALLDDRVLCGIGDLEREVLIIQALLQLGEHKVNYLAYLRAHKRLVVDYLVKAVEELGTELLVQEVLYLLSCSIGYLTLLVDALKDKRG